MPEFIEMQILGGLVYLESLYCVIAVMVSYSKMFILSLQHLRKSHLRKSHFQFSATKIKKIIFETVPHHPHQKK